MSNPNIVNLTGQEFGRLTVLERAENDKQGNAQWLCQCICGNKKVIRGNALRRGRTSSCGCLLVVWDQYFNSLFEIQGRENT